jgi:hypothetical protein
MGVWAVAYSELSVGGVTSISLDSLDRVDDADGYGVV